MLLLPPGSAKSTYASVQFPPHFIGQRSGLHVLACSHSIDLAESFGRRCRNLVDTHETDLGYKLCEHSRSAGRWETSNNGNYLAAGVGTAIAGYRADLGIIDDPIRNREDADSKLVRDKHWDWYNFDFKTRLKPDAAVVFIYTPWHEDDLGHRILATEGADWTVIRIPFYAEDNDPLGRPKGGMLWPEWYKPEMYPKDSRVASALYQLRPAPEEGDYFKKDWLIEYTHPDQLPKDLRIYVGSDHAVSMREEADLTCLLPVGVDSDENIWVLPDVFWQKADTGRVVSEIIGMVKRRKPIEWFAEAGHISKSIGPFLRKRMEEERVYFFCNEINSSRDKPTRSQAIRGRMAMGKVRFPAFASWWHLAKHQMLSFPVGTHDDFVDALSEIGQGLDKLLHPFDEPQEDDEENWNAPFRPTVAWLKAAGREAEQELESRYNDR